MIQSQEINDVLKAIAEHSPDHVMLLDENLRVVYINHVTEGLTLEEVIGRDITSFVPETQEMLTGILKETLKTGKMGSWQSEYISPLGETHTFQTRAIRLDNGPKNARLHLTATDVTSLVRRDQQLKNAAAVFTKVKEAIVIADHNGQIIDVNSAFTEITHLQKESVMGKHAISLLPRNVAKALAVPLANLQVGGYWQGEFKLSNIDGEEVYVLSKISAIKDDKNTVQNYVILLSDVTEQKQYQQKLEHIASHDPLTNLPNRYLLSQRMSMAMEDANKKGTLLAVLYVDLDGFKEINDNKGHQIGDKLLIDLAQRMTTILDRRDTVARIGGDEFVIVVPDIDSRPHHEAYFYSILDAIAKPTPSQVGLLSVSASLGVTYYPQDKPLDSDHLIRQADIAMYDAKVHGKNRLAVFDTKRDEHKRSYGQVLAEFQLALRRDELRLYFQPKVNMHTGQIIGAEVLLRWQHPEQGLLTPDKFLPAVLDDPLAIQLDHWVLTKTLEQLDQWTDANFNLITSINICTRSLEDPDFVASVANSLARRPKVSPSTIILEVLESSAFGDLDHVSQVILECKKLGVEFSLDDFGTGFSTLTFLKKLPADEVKIDMTFVRDMLSDEGNLAIIRGILGLAEAFGKRVIAEGVETEAHGLALLELGCHTAQGYAIAKPMPAEEFFTWRATWRPYQSWINQLSQRRA